MPEDVSFPTAKLPTDTEEDIWYRSEMYKVLDKIVEDKFIEKKLEDFPLWAGNTKSMKLTFFNDRDVTVLENEFEADVCRYLRSLPPYEQTYDKHIALGQARMIFMSNIRRSLGTPVQKINERVAILSQWKINTPMEASPQAKPPIWKRIFG